jgi:hypothetical protein
LLSRPLFRSYESRLKAGATKAAHAQLKKSKSKIFKRVTTWFENLKRTLFMDVRRGDLQASVILSNRMHACGLQFVSTAKTQPSGAFLMFDVKTCTDPTRAEDLWKLRDMTFPSAWRHCEKRRNGHHVVSVCCMLLSATSSVVWQLNGQSGDASDARVRVSADRIMCIT